MITEKKWNSFVQDIVVFMVIHNTPPCYAIIVGTDGYASGGGYWMPGTPASFAGSDHTRFSGPSRVYCVEHKKLLLNLGVRGG